MTPNEKYLRKRRNNCETKTLGKTSHVCVLVSFFPFLFSFFRHIFLVPEGKLIIIVKCTMSLSLIKLHLSTDAGKLNGRIRWWFFYKTSLFVAFYLQTFPYFLQPFFCFNLYLLFFVLFLSLRCSFIPFVFASSFCIFFLSILGFFRFCVWSPFSIDLQHTTIHFIYFCFVFTFYCWSLKCYLSWVRIYIFLCICNIKTEEDPAYILLSTV